MGSEDVELTHWYRLKFVRLIATQMPVFVFEQQAVILGFAMRFLKPPETLSKRCLLKFRPSSQSPGVDSIEEKFEWLFDLRRTLIQT
jgi:hypothetical protein